MPLLPQVFTVIKCRGGSFLLPPPWRLHLTQSGSSGAGGGGPKAAPTAKAEEGNKQKRAVLLAWLLLFALEQVISYRHGRKKNRKAHDFPFSPQTRGEMKINVRFFSRNCFFPRNCFFSTATKCTFGKGSSKVMFSLPSRGTLRIC